MGWTLERHPWLDDPEVRGRTTMAGYGLGRAVADGRFDPLPIRLSAVGRLIAADPPQVAVVAGVPRGAGFAFAGSIGWADVLARVAQRVVVEVDDRAPDLGGPVIEGNIVATLTRPPSGLPADPLAREPDEIDRTIASNVLALLPDAATLQFGLGATCEAIVQCIDRPIRVWSGLVTDEVARLHGRGLLAAPAVATYCWGGRELGELADLGMLRLTPCATTNDSRRVGAIPRFVACNTALQVGLDGSVNVERVGSRIVAGMGGHPDFCLGGSWSAGGTSIVALRSTTGNGTSTIVDTVDVVSTPRTDVGFVVTEYGAADLRGCSDTERSVRLRSIAAPEHRRARWA